MKKPSKLVGPVVIGGVGGSGTRVISEILLKLGFYIGSDLNISKDNLWFTYLFRWPRWFNRVRKKHGYEIKNRLNIFEKVMTTGLVENKKHYLPKLMWMGFNTILLDLPQKRSRIWLNTQLKFIRSRIRSFRRSKGFNPSKHIGWGWKEPNTLIFIKYLVEQFKDMKYVLVMRNGLDMAFSSNKKQLHNWGHLFNVNIPNSPEKMPQAALQYW
ncbi:MAG: hypothetical protein ACFE96_13150, partial [Candidatus Hermodarchaeota archaeon]